MHKGSLVVVFSSSRSKSVSSRSKGSSTRSWRVVFEVGAVVGESGLMTSEEVELGQRLWPRVEKVGVIGEDALEPAEESRECAGVN